MKKLLPVCAALLVWTTTAAAQEKKDTFDSVTKELIAAMKTTSDVLETVKDKMTADHAKPKVRAIAKTMADLKQRMDKLGKPSKEQEEELKKKYGKMVEDQVRRLLAESIRLQNVEGGKELLKELEDLGK